jgi:predicted metal-dependent hydrolase
MRCDVGVKSVEHVWDDAVAYDLFPLVDRVCAMRLRNMVLSEQNLLLSLVEITWLHVPCW